MHRIDKKSLDGLYRNFNKKKFIHPDPLEFLSRYRDTPDREILGLMAASLAYGKVAQILRSVRYVAEILGPAPKNFIMNTSPEKIALLFRGFKHRFTDENDISLLINQIRRILIQYGSLHECFRKGYSDSDETIMNALNVFVKEITGAAKFKNSMLIPDPLKGSACKRLNLYLRWMVRRDSVDPGGWIDIPPSKLIIPLDTHMHRFGLMFNFTKRKNADLRTAMEITEGFRLISPADPVKYDFAITRFGIRNELSFKSLREFLNRE